MKQIKQFKLLFFVAGLLFASVTACDKSDVENSEMLKDADGNMYETVIIGTQIWMAENLRTTKYNDGTEIANVTNDSIWGSLITGACCNYGNIESNSESYGKLYNWYAVSSGKLAPEGWHVATDEDWTILEEYLIAKGFNYDGTKEKDKIAKAIAASTNWGLSDVKGTPGYEPEENNSAGFSALPAGSRSYKGKYSNVGMQGLWWSSTGNISKNAYYRLMSNYTDYLLRDEKSKNSGFSVRLVKD